MKFKSLSHAPWIKNAVIPINDYFNLSVSYGDGEWYVGDINSYEVAIQVSKPNCKFRSLVSFKDNRNGNIYSNCNQVDISNLIEKAKTLEYGGEIEVFAIGEKEKERRWGHRFFCAKGYDLKQKLDYVKRVFVREDKWRFVEP